MDGPSVPSRSTQPGRRAGGDSKSADRDECRGGSAQSGANAPVGARPAAYGEWHAVARGSGRRAGVVSRAQSRPTRSSRG
jgi:hypothetical protein